MLLKLLKLFLDFYFICIDYMHGTMCMPGTCGGRKMVLDSLELELLMVVSHSQSQGRVSAGN